jgi:hypothetical protein
LLPFLGVVIALILPFFASAVNGVTVFSETGMELLRGTTLTMPTLLGGAEVHFPANPAIQFLYALVAVAALFAAQRNSKAAIMAAVLSALGFLVVCMAMYNGHSSQSGFFGLVTVTVQLGLGFYLSMLSLATAAVLNWLSKDFFSGAAHSPVGVGPGMRSQGIPQSAPHSAPSGTSPAPEFKMPKMPPLSPRTKKLIFAGVGVAALALAAGLLVWQHGRAPSSAAIRGFIEKAERSANFEIVNISSNATPVSPGVATVRYHETVKLHNPTYTAVDLNQYLSSQFGFDPSTAVRIRAIAGGKSGPHILKFANLPSYSEPLGGITLVKETTPAGKVISLDGILDARRVEDGWSFRETQVPNPSEPLTGLPKTDIKGRVFVVTDAGDMAQVKALVQSEGELLSRLATAENDYFRWVLNNLLAKVKPGSVFAGTATSTNNETERVFIEVRSLDASSGGITALMRNDGGWTDSRRFKGSFAFDRDEAMLKMTLTTQNQDYIPNSGPFLGTTGGWTLVFDLDDTNLTQEPRASSPWRYKLDLLSDEDAAKLKAELQAEFVSAMAATADGSVFLGTAVSKNQAETYKYFLRFVAQQGGGAPIANLEVPGRPHQRRPFGVTIIPSRYRSEGWPIRLETRDRQNIAAPNEQNSPATVPWAYHVRFKLENGHLVGDTAGSTFNFSAATPDDIAYWDKFCRDSEQRLLSFVQNGANYDVFLHSKNGSYTEPARLTFTRVDQGGEFVEARLDSADIDRVHATLRGTVAFDDHRVTLSKTGGVMNTGGRLHAPLFVQTYNTVTLDLIVGDSSVSGETRDQSWSIEIPHGIAAAATPSSSDTPPPQPSSTAVGDYPTAPGAYAWIDGKWVSLPHNNGRVSQGLLFGVKLSVNGVNLSGNNTPPPRADKLANLVFDGADLIPSADAASVKVVVIGPYQQLPVSALNQYPVLRSYPHLEMAPTVSDGPSKRVAGLYRIAPGFAGFSDTRAPAALEQVSDVITVLTATQPLPPGNYAIFSAPNCYELNLH